MEILTTLKDTPVPTLLVIGGFIFLFLGLATIKKPIIIDIQPPSNRKLAIVFGAIFVAAGLYSLLLTPSLQAGGTSTETPTTVTIIVTNIPPTDNATMSIPLETAVPSKKSGVGFENNCINSDMWVPIKTEINENGCWQLPQSGIASQDGSLILFVDKNKTIDWFGIYTPITQNVDIYFTVRVNKLFSPNNDSARIAFGIIDPNSIMNGDFLYYREYTNSQGRIEFGKAMLDTAQVSSFNPTSANQKVKISVRGIVLNIFIDDKLIVGPANLSTAKRAFGIFYRPVKDSNILVYISDLKIEEK